MILMMTVLSFSETMYEPSVIAKDYIDYYEIFDGKDTKIEEITTNMKEKVIVNLTPNYTFLIDEPDKTKIGEQQLLKLYIGPLFNPKNSFIDFAEAKLKISLSDDGSNEDKLQFVRTLLAVPEDGVTIDYGNIRISQLEEEVTGNKFPWNELAKTPETAFNWQQELSVIEKRYFKEKVYNEDLLENFLLEKGKDLGADVLKDSLPKVLSLNGYFKTFSILTDFIDTEKNIYDNQQKALQRLEMNVFDLNKYDVEEFYWEDINKITDMDGKISNNIIISIPFTYERILSEDEKVAVNVLANFENNTRVNFKIYYELGNGKKQSTIFDFDQNLLAYWGFNNDSETAIEDESGNGYNGEKYGGIKYVNGVLGKAVKFNGKNGRISIEKNVLQSGFPFTLSFWVKLDEEGDGTVFGQGDWGTNGFNYYYALSHFWVLEGEGFGWSFGNGGAGSSQHRNSFRAEYDFKRDKWYNIVLVATDNYMKSGKVFLNGKLISFKDEFVGPEDYTMAMRKGTATYTDFSGGNLDIGTVKGNGRGYGSDNHEAFFANTVDEIKIFNKALSDEEIETLFKIVK